jgi:hypothetical protein
MIPTIKKTNNEQVRPCLSSAKLRAHDHPALCRSTITAQELDTYLSPWVRSTQRKRERRTHTHKHIIYIQPQSERETRAHTHTHIHTFVCMYMYIHTISLRERDARSHTHTHNIHTRSFWALTCRADVHSGVGQGDAS